MAQTAVASLGCLTHFKTAGTFYDFGFNTGSQFRERTRAFLNEFAHHQKTVLPFYDSPEGRTFYEESLRATQACFPHYVREIRGLADGLGLPFEHIFMANICESNVESLLKEKTASPGGQNDPEYGCTTIFVNSQETRVIVHNEDHDPLIKKYGYLVSADIAEEGRTEKFTSLCYPGSLPGRAFNVNHGGMVFTSNVLCPAKLVRGSISRHFLTRALAGTENVEEAVKQARNEPFGCAYGFTANLCSKDGHMACLEVGPGQPQAAVHVQEIARPTGPDAAAAASHYYHFNAYKHLQVAQLRKLLSSTHRAQRTSELPAPRCLQDALDIAADTEDPLYPIFRTPRPTDPTQTLCTAAFDAVANELRLYDDRKGLLSNTPLLKIPLFV